MTKIKEEEAAIKKPIARRPGLSHRKSLSELLSDAVKDSSPADVSEGAVITIRPKTVRFKPTGKVELLAPKSNATSNLVYKPIAKFVTSATLSVLASLRSNDTKPRQEIAKRNDVLVNSEEDKCFLLPSNNEGQASSDGHSWRKYGQKLVKGSEYPRSYYKCTYPNCLVKKMVERTLDEQIAEVVYKGEHNHSKYQGPAAACDAAQIEILLVFLRESMNQLWMYCSMLVPQLPMTLRKGNVRKEVKLWEWKMTALKAKEGSAEKATSERGNVVQSNSDSKIIEDGFRWRKYGQKVFKGNSYPRSYYKPTTPKCNVRKYVERTSEDPATFITTFEGRHNHEMPIKLANPEASNTRTGNKSLINTYESRDINWMRI